MRDINSALESRDAAKLKISVHTLNGSLRVLGCKQPMELAISIEQLAANNELEKSESLIAELKRSID